MFTNVLLVTLLSLGCSQAQNTVFKAPAPECETVRGQKCVFPFTYRGKRYWECTYDSTTNGKPWCAYETRRDGTAVPGKWEDCDPSLCLFNDNVCHTVSGPDAGNTCKFPFTFNGRTYEACAPWIWGGGNNGKRWCSTRTDRFGNHVNGQGNYGFCGSCGYSYGRGAAPAFEARTASGDDETAPDQNQIPADPAATASTDVQFPSK